MTQRGSNFNMESGWISKSVAPLTNVSLCNKALIRAKDRPMHLPGFVCFYGPAGWGKSVAASWVRSEHNAYYIQCCESWTKKAFLWNMLKAMGIVQKKTIWEMVSQICEQLANSGRPLIIDELDKLVEKKGVEIVRDIYEGSGFSAILLIGEEKLPQKLQRWERFHSRVLDWVQAQPADFDDCQYLADFYSSNITITEDVLKKLHAASKGSARRIVVNIELVRDIASEIGLTTVDAATWGDRKFHTGEAPPTRVHI